jgi:preprotein translocase subunit SecB
MAEEQNQEPLMTSDENASAQFQIQKLYVKDVSLEVPNAPQVFQEAGQVDIKMSLAQRVEELGDNLHEVVLTVTVTATVGEKTAYLVEVAQAGIFMLTGFNEQSAHAVMNIMCPNTLFPYARQLISTLVADGGFPPLVLQPVNFEQMYAQRMQQMMEEQQTGAADQGEEEEVEAEFQTNH